MKRILAPAGSVIRKSYSITATPEVLSRFEQFLAYVQHCTQEGHSITVGFDVDGDDERFRVLQKLPKVDPNLVQRHTHGFEMYVTET